MIDRRLPDGDGRDLISIIRDRWPDARVMMLSALDSLSHRVSTLDAGADDYLTKPFEGEELIARVRACLRRPGGKPIPPIKLGQLIYDPQSRCVSVRGEIVQLRRRELLLLESLLARANTVTPRENLMHEVFSARDEVQASVIDTLVSRLRQHLQLWDSGVVILTVRGVGYMITEKAR